MTMMESHPIGTVRQVPWPEKACLREAESLVARPFGYHHVPGQQGPTKSTYRWLRRLCIMAFRATSC